MADFYVEQITRNYWGLHSLIQASDTQKEIEAASKEKQAQSFRNIPYFNRWHIVWVSLTHPFYSILSVFSSAIAFLAYCFHLPKCARIFTVLSKHWTREWEELCNQWKIQPSLLVPAFNVHKLFTWDVYGLDVSYDDIRDKAIRSLTYRSTEFINGIRRAMDHFFNTLETRKPDQNWSTWLYTQDKFISQKERENVLQEFISKYTTNPEEAFTYIYEKYSKENIQKPLHLLYEELKGMEINFRSASTLSLFSDKGVCKGASLWFIFLFLKTKHFFTQPMTHLATIAKKFTQGMPKEATILHAFDNSDSLLNLQRTDMKEHQISLYELDKNMKSAEEKISSLPFGIYRVGMYCHSSVLIKYDSDKQFVWDPQFGLYPMNSIEFLHMIKEYHYKQGDPRSSIYFHKYENPPNMDKE